MTSQATPKKKGHFGKGLLAGAIFGIAAGIFLTSKEGKQVTKRIETRAKDIEKKLRTEFKKKKELTEEAYDESVDRVLAYYLKSKQIAKTELPSLKKILRDKWVSVRSELESVEAPAKKTVAKKRKTTAKK
ncbi:MAG: YtxH domain-containing protein [Candidatus Uhrbacteria bacterium]|nr:YtxH domain-containing protein [Candidatus Uhrbacteria bacterium]